MNKFRGHTYFTSERCIRVEDVEHSVDDVGDEVDVALSPSTSCVHAERLFSGKTKKQQFGVMDVELVRGLPLACALLQICVVPAQQRQSSNVSLCATRKKLCSACVSG